MPIEENICMPIMSKRGKNPLLCHNFLLPAHKTIEIFWNFLQKQLPLTTSLVRGQFAELQPFKWAYVVLFFQGEIIWLLEQLQRDELFLHRPGFSTFSLCLPAPSKAACEEARMADVPLFIDDEHHTGTFCTRNSSAFPLLLHQKCHQQWLSSNLGKKNSQNDLLNGKESSRICEEVEGALNIWISSPFVRVKQNKMKQVWVSAPVLLCSIFTALLDILHHHHHMATEEDKSLLCHQNCALDKPRSSIYSSTANICMAGTSCRAV